MAYNKAKRGLGWISLIASITLIVYALWIPAKAHVAQILLDVAWHATLESGHPQRPWPWADHYPVVQLSAPAHGIEQIVLAGDSGAVLAFAPGENQQAKKVPGGARIISAHRDTHFRFLEAIRIGDHVTLTDRAGDQSYRVTATDIVDANITRISPAANPGGLIMVTCYPFDALSANGSERFVVTAEPVAESQSLIMTASVEQ